MRVKLGDVCERGTSNLKLSDVSEKNGEFSVFGASGYIGSVDFYQQGYPYVAVVKDGAGIGRAMLCPGKTSVIGTMQYLLPKDNILPKYLFYVVKYMNLEKYFTGATIPHIYFKDYKNEEFNFDFWERQVEIVSVLSKCEKVIDLCKQELQLLDKLIKARFVELFGDPELNPRGLPVLPWNAVFLTTTGKLDSNAMVENGRYPFFTCAKESYKINSYAFDCEALLLAGNNAAGIYDVKHYKGKFNAYQRTYVLRLMNEKWSYILFKRQLEDKLQYLQSQSKGTNTRYLTLGILNELRFVVPPVAEQEQFAVFVEQTDKSKLAIQQSLDKLKTLRKSLMQEYYGQGE